MNLKSALATLSFGILSLSGSQASVSFLMDAEVLADSGGVPISLTSAVAIVVDTAGDGFGPVVPGTVSVNDFLNGSDDRIVFIDEPGISSGEPGLVFTATFPITIDNTPGPPVPSSGDQVAVYWFPNVGTDGAISAGQEYGMYTDQVGIDGSEVWVVPPDNTTNHVLVFATTDSMNIGGSNPPSAGHASLRVIPEPSSAILLGLAAFAFGSRRRR